MNFDVLEARYVRAHTIWLRFRDGTSGEIDLEPSLRGPMLEPLRDLAYFQRFNVHPDFDTLAWPNGADFDPEYLYDNVRHAVARSVSEE